MVWDIVAFPASGGKMEKPEVDAACLAVMEKALAYSLLRRAGAKVPAAALAGFKSA